jgi:membrane protein insertase Oxa1/YidC/SpoIIIJ
MKYVFPIIIFFIAYTISAAIALYLMTSNLFMIGQEIYVRRGMGKKDDIGQSVISN